MLDKRFILLSWLPALPDEWHSPTTIGLGQPMRNCAASQENLYAYLTMLIVKPLATLYYSSEITPSSYRKEASRLLVPWYGLGHIVTPL